jgi:hypothetical protein
LRQNLDIGMPLTDFNKQRNMLRFLDLRFAYSTNGIEIVEFDYTTGVERTIQDFPAPDDLWARLRRAEGIRRR